MKIIIILTLFITIIQQGETNWNISDICIADSKLGCSLRTHRFQCGQNYCTKDAKSCEIFAKLKFLFKFDVIYQKKNEFENLISSIQACRKTVRQIYNYISSQKKLVLKS